MTKEEIQQAAEKAYPFLPGNKNEVHNHSQLMSRRRFVKGAQFVLDHQAKDVEEFRGLLFTEVMRGNFDDENDVTNWDQVFDWFLPHLNTQKEGWVEFNGSIDTDSELLYLMCYDSISDCRFSAWYHKIDNKFYIGNDLMKFASVGVTHYFNVPNPPAKQ